jgi:hypothetical protein
MEDMDSSGEKKEDFFYVPSKYILHEILKVKGTIHE